jgi:hypothetical protein
MIKGDTVDKIMAYESGEMSDEEIISFFQELINSGLVWNLQGSYGRTAKQLIDAGICTAKES